MGFSELRFRGNEATALTTTRLAEIAAKRMQHEARANLICCDLQNTEHGIIRPFSLNEIAVFRSEDRDLPAYRFPMMENKHWHFHGDRGIPVAHEEAMGFLPEGSGIFEMLGPTSKFEFTLPYKEGSAYEEAFRTGTYDVVRVMSHRFLT